MVPIELSLKTSGWSFRGGVSIFYENILTRMTPRYCEVSPEMRPLGVVDKGLDYLSSSSSCTKLKPQ